MEYVVMKRFKRLGIDGMFNLPYGTIVIARDGFLFTGNGQKICAVTSSNGKAYFRPKTTIVA